MAGSDQEPALAMLRELRQKLESGADGNAGLADLLRRMLLALESSARAEEELRDQCERLLAHQEMLDERLLRVETNRLFRAWTSVVLKSRQIYRHATRALLGSTEGRDISAAEYVRWVTHEQAGLPSVATHRAIADGWRRKPSISIIMPLVGRDERWLAESVASVRAQSYENWQLHLVAQASQPGPVMRLVEESRIQEPRIQFTTLPQSGAVSAGTTEMARGEYLGFVDSHDILSPFALHYVVESIQDTDFDLIYSDEDRIDSANTRRQPLFKPDWSPTLLRACMYIGHLMVVRRQAFEGAGGFRSQFNGVADHDLALRIMEHHPKVHHIPRVLYHRRIGESSISKAKTPAVEAGQQLSLAEGSSVSIIVCSKTPRLLERCVNSVRGTTRGIACEFVVVHHEDSGPDHEMRRVLGRLGVKVVPYRDAFHFSKMNNIGASQASAPYLLFLNDDVYAARKGWCERLLAHLEQPGVGIAGALLRYPGGEIQHAGVAVGIGDCAGHPGRFLFASELWPWLTMTREVSSVTGACMAVRADVFRQLGGFDAAFPVNYNDVDLCLRAGAAGYRVVCVASEGLTHEECGTRLGVTHLGEREAFYERWMEVLRRPDPYSSPSLLPSEKIAFNRQQTGASVWPFRRRSR
jgi:O-antigen biosynthesis protein